MTTLRLLIFSVLSSTAWTAPLPILVPVQSNAKEIGGLKFSVSTQSDWRSDLRLWNDAHVGSVMIQLVVSNQSEKEILFPTFDTFFPILTGPDGKELRLIGSRDATTPTPHFLLKSGQTLCYPLLGKLESTDKNPIFEWRDRTGTIQRISLAPGRYSLCFHLHSLAWLPVYGEKPANLWSAVGTTSAVTFRLDSDEPLPRTAKTGEQGEDANAGHAEE